MLTCSPSITPHPLPTQYATALRNIAKTTAHSFFKMGNFEQASNVAMKKTIFELLCQAAQIEIESLQTVRLFSSAAEISHAVHRLLGEVHVMTSFIIKGQPFPDANTARERTLLLHLQLQKLVDDERLLPAKASLNPIYAGQRPSSVEEEQVMTSHDRCAMFREAFRRGAAALDARDFNDEAESKDDGETRSVASGPPIPAFETDLEGFAAALPKGTVLLHFIQFEKDALGVSRRKGMGKKRRRERGNLERKAGKEENRDQEDGKEVPATPAATTTANEDKEARKEVTVPRATAEEKTEKDKPKALNYNYGVYVMTQDRPHDIYLLDLGPRHEIDENIAKYRALLGRIAARKDEVAGTKQMKEEGKGKDADEKNDHGDPGIWGKDVCYDENDEDDLIEWGFELYSQMIQPIKHIISGYDRLAVVPVGELDLCPFYSMAEDPGGKVFLVDSFTVLLARCAGDVILGRDEGAPGDLSEPFRIGDCDYEYGLATLTDLRFGFGPEDLLDSEEQEIRLLKVLKPHKIFSFYELELDLDEEASSAEVTRAIMAAALDQAFPPGLENDGGDGGDRGDGGGNRALVSLEAAQQRSLLEHRLVRAVVKDGLNDDEVILDLPNTSYTEIAFPEDDIISKDAATARVLLHVERPVFCHIGCRTVSNGVLLSGVNAWGSGGSLPQDGDEEGETAFLDFTKILTEVNFDGTRLVTLGFHNPAQRFAGPPKVLSTIGSDALVTESLRETIFGLVFAGARSVLATLCAFECSAMARFQADLFRRFYLYASPFLRPELPWTLAASFGVADALRKA